MLKSTTRLVQLNVIVQKGGKPAGGLKKDDFVITDIVSKEGLTYRQVVQKDSRATQLRIVVRDASSGSMGSVTVPFRELKG